MKRCPTTTETWLNLDVSSGKEQVEWREPKSGKSPAELLLSSFALEELERSVMMEKVDMEMTPCLPS